MLQFLGGTVGPLMPARRVGGHRRLQPSPREPPRKVRGRLFSSNLKSMADGSADRVFLQCDTVTPFLNAVNHQPGR